MAFFLIKNSIPKRENQKKKKNLLPTYAEEQNSRGLVKLTVIHQ